MSTISTQSCSAEASEKLTYWPIATATVHFGGPASGQGLVTCTWLAASQAFKSGKWKFSVLKLDGIWAFKYYITQLFFFPGCSKIPSLYFQIFTCFSLLYLYFHLFSFSHTSFSSPWGAALFAALLFSSDTSVWACKFMWNTFTPFLPTHLSCVVHQQGRAAYILLLDNFYCSQICLFTIKFSKAAFLLHWT